MLHRGNDDLISRLDKSTPIAGSNNIDRLGRPFGNNNFVFVLRTDKSLNFPAGDLESSGRDLAEVMHAAVYVTIHIGIIPCDRIDNLLGFLCGGTVIKIHQGLTVHFPT